MKLKPPQRQVQLVRDGEVVHILMSAAYVSTDADGVDVVVEWANRSPSLDALIEEAKQLLGVKDRKRRKTLRLVKSE